MLDMDIVKMLCFYSSAAEKLFCVDLHVFGFLVNVIYFLYFFFHEAAFVFVVFLLNMVMNMVLLQSFIKVLSALALIVPILIAVAYLTLIERKFVGACQRRKGPNVVGFFGLMQPLADALKLFVKESLFPVYSNKLMFIAAPIITLTLGVLSWAVIPFAEGIVLSDVSVGFLFLFAVSSLGVYGIVLAGWSSNSKYAFLGAMRSAAQMVSYEVSIGLIVMLVLMSVESFSFSSIVLFQHSFFFIIPFYVVFVLFLISALAETNRAPFDLPEAEAELVSGYNVEYSSMGFALFFIGEYSNIILMSVLTVLLFMGGWICFDYILLDNFFLSLKIVYIACVFIWVRSSFPRYRYDQLMRLGWKVFLPVALGLFVLLYGFFQ